MNSFVRRAATAFAVLSITSLALACGSSPGESVATSEEAYGGCPLGYVKDCSNEGPGGKLICWCDPVDGYLSITQVMQTPTASDTSSLDLSARPYPPELAGMGCTRTAVFHNSSYDTTGARVWFCPVSSFTKPSQIQPLPQAPYIQYLQTGGTIKSQTLGSPVSGYVALSEDITVPCEHLGCIINHSCSGTCSDLTP
jgi:hypothetical protein